MTSNLGSEQLLVPGKHWTKESILQVINPVIQRHFRPEFINRLDEVLPFLPLQEKDMEKIVLIQLETVKKRLLERHVHLSWDDAVVEHLAEEGYDPLFGARPLKRLIQNEVVNLLSNSILRGEIKHESKICLTLQDKGVIGLAME